MSQSVIQRVDLDSLAKPGGPSQGSQRLQERKFPSHLVRWFVVPLSLLLCIALSMVTITASNAYSFTITATLVAVMVMATVFMMALVANPLLRLIYIGRWLGEDKVDPITLIQAWAGRLTIGSLLAAAVLMGPAAAAWAYGLIFAVIAVALVVDVITGNMMGRTGSRFSSFGKGAIGLAIAMAVALVLQWVMSLVWPSAMGILALPALAGVVYSLLWMVSTHAFTRAELMTVMASLVVASGVSTFGLTEQLVPIITTPYNAEWNTPQARWAQELHPNLRKEIYITDPAAIQIYREGMRRTAEGELLVQPSDDEGLFQSIGSWTSYYVTVSRNVPWDIWLPPLGYWMIFVIGCYAMFYSLTYTVLDFWADREKIIFPLAQLRENLLPDENSNNWLPDVCRSIGFWTALLVAGGIFTYNGYVRFGWLGDMGMIPTGMAQNTFTLIAQGTFLEGISAGSGGMRFAFIFTAVGIAFLLPLEISFSIWFYYLLSRVMMLMLVGAGYGRTANDFASDWLYRQSEITAQGMGALLVFSVYMLFRAMKDTGIQVFSSKRKTSARLLSALPIIGLVASITVVTMWIWWMWSWNLSYLFWAFVFVIFLVLLTLGLMRITAEGGVYWFQSHASFFHLWKMLALGKFLPGTMIGPLLPVYSVLFLDIKTFMAPNLINGAKMQKDVGGSRALYHVNMIFTMLTAVVVSVGFAIVMCYARGAQRMNGWFYSSGPKSAMTTAQQAASSVPEFNGWMTGWAVGGGLWIVISVIARRTIFWFPHPVGYVMLINPMIHTLWFSFFVGWICKKLVVKYGGKNTFDKTRYIFIGLIMGEIIAISIWSIVAFYTGQSSAAMTLNNTF